MVLLALTSNHRFVAIAVPIPESGRSCETARGRLRQVAVRVRYVLSMRCLCSGGLEPVENF